MIPLRDNIPHRRLPFVTISLLVVNVIVFLFEMSLGRDLQDFIVLYGFIPKYPRVISLFSSMFLHANILHLGGNMLSLWIFADNVEDVLGHFNFLVFYIVSGLGAAFSHYLLNTQSVIPIVGASGAISGVLGAYFLLFPQARVVTLIPFFFFWEIIEIPALIFLGVWFIFQFIYGVASIGQTGAGVAFWAHIGGFVTGIALLRMFLAKRGRQYWI